MSGLYLDNGYLDMENIILRSKTPFIFITGGRGTGKTYGALKTIVLHNMRTLYLRRTQVQIDIIKKPEMNPFKVLNEKENFNVFMFKLSKYNSLMGDGYYDGEGKLKLCDNGERGYTAALSTFASMRGADFSDVDIIIYDEFIPEINAASIRGEYEALINLYETVNRNRELEGRKPVILLCLSNSTNAANAIYMGAKITTLAYKMRSQNRVKHVDIKRGYTLYVLGETSIGSQKRETALYKFAGKNYVEHSIENKFVDDNPATVVSRNVREYKPYVTIGELTVYQHKNKDLLYVTDFSSGSPPKYSHVGNDSIVFMGKYAPHIWKYMRQNLVEYELYEYEVLLKKYMGVVL